MMLNDPWGIVVTSRIMSLPSDTIYTLFLNNPPMIGMSARPGTLSIVSRLAWISATRNVRESLLFRTKQTLSERLGQRAYQFYQLRHRSRAWFFSSCIEYV